MQTKNLEAGSRLRDWREQVAQLKQRELADYLGVSNATIGYWENGGILPRREALLWLALQHYSCTHNGHAD